MAGRSSGLFRTLLRRWPAAPTLVETQEAYRTGRETRQKTRPRFSQHPEFQTDQKLMLVSAALFIAQIPTECQHAHVSAIMDADSTHPHAQAHEGTRMTMCTCVPAAAQPTAFGAPPLPAALGRSSGLASQACRAAAPRATTAAAWLAGGAWLRPVHLQPRPVWPLPRVPAAAVCRLEDDTPSSLHGVTGIPLP